MRIPLLCSNSKPCKYAHQHPEKQTHIAHEKIIELVARQDASNKRQTGDAGPCFPFDNGLHEHGSKCSK